MIGEIKCPVCNSIHTKKVFSLDAGTAGKQVIPDHPVQSSRLSGEIAALWQSDRIEFHRCLQCTFGFAWPFIAGNDTIYSTLYYKDFSYPSEKWEFDRAMEMIRTFGPSSGSTLLELGAGNGTFLDKVSELVMERGRIYSTEYSSAGRTEIQRKGFQCFNKSISELTAENLPPLDIICMFQVLEHMDDLEGVFQNLNILGSPSCHLIIAVPNGVLRSFYDKWGVHLDIPPIHVGRFTPETFRHLGTKHGWNVVESCTEPQSYFFKVRKFVFDRYDRNQFTRKTERSEKKAVKYFFRYLVLLLLAVRFLPVLIYLLRPGTGTSLLVHLQHRPQ